MTRSAAPRVEFLVTDVSAEERQRLYAQLDDWYWEQGRGVFLGEPSRTI
jgi:hypothetical protein